MKSLYKLFAVASMAVSAVSYADSYGSDDSMSSNVDTKAPMKMITPSAGPRVENAIDAVISADFIYFDATQNGLAYAYNNVAGASYATTTGTTYYPDFGFDPGFRVAAGLDLAHDAWDVLAQYTWFHTGNQTTNTTFSNPTENLTEDSAANQASLSAAKNIWRLRLDVIDADLGRHFFISQYLSFRPFFGLKAAWNRQKYNTIETLIDETTVDTIKQNQYAFGIGIRTGLNTNWQFSKNWSVYGNSAFSLMNTHERNIFKVSQGTSGYLASNESEQNTIQPVIELAMGLCYDYFFDDDNYHLGISAGWEFQYWNNNNFFGTYATPSSSGSSARFGDLSIQGFDLKFRLDF